MNTIQVIARIVHIGFGVFWAGAIFFVVFLLTPAIREAGPDGARVMQALGKRKFMTILPVTAFLTILSGAYLYWRISGELGHAWMQTAYGTTLTIGALSAIVGFVIGLFIMRPAALGAGALGARIATVTDAAERESITREIGWLKSRSRKSSIWVAVCLLVAVVTMAAARYL